MNDRDDRIFYLGAGPLAAMLLGVALIPLRGFTSASNLTFAFLALIIVVAEFGGRSAAVATALCSALSLDFFLTEPYLSLRMNEKHDLIAFVGLTCCGLIAAALGSQRDERVSRLRCTRAHLEVLHSALAELEAVGPIEPQITRILHAARVGLPLASAVVRDDREQVVATSARTHALPVPTQILQPDTLLPAGVSARILSAEGPPLPKEGGRLALVAGRGQVGWLDLWGNGAPASVQSRRTLCDVARLVARRLAETAPRPESTA